MLGLILNTLAWVSSNSGWTKFIDKVFVGWTKTPNLLLAAISVGISLMISHMKLWQLVVVTCIPQANHMTTKLMSWNLASCYNNSLWIIIWNDDWLTQISLWILMWLIIPIWLYVQVLYLCCILYYIFSEVSVVYSSTFYDM